MNSSNSNKPVAAADAHFHAIGGLAGLGQQILNLLESARQRAETRRALASMTLRDLDDCGMTFADVDPAMPDMFANDFRVQHVATAIAA